METALLHNHQTNFMEQSSNITEVHRISNYTIMFVYINHFVVSVVGVVEQ